MAEQWLLAWTDGANPAKRMSRDAGEPCPEQGKPNRAMSELFEWFHAHEGLVAAAAVLSVTTFLGTLIAVPILLTRMRADYFVGEAPPRDGWRGRHPIVRILGLFAKNLLGAAMLLMGFAMLVLPGQGLLTILIGIALLSFPGKRRLERRIASQRTVRRSIDWIRARANRPPLVFDDVAVDAPSGEEVRRSD